MVLAIWGTMFFSDNGNGGTIYALYNNTPNTLMMNNCCRDKPMLNTLANL
ncbi:MAG: hypothetical protein R2783_01015 [Gelidibacter sp.]